MSIHTFRSIISILSASELTLGSYLHALRVPLTGQLMSLNQCFWLNVSKVWSPIDSPFKISVHVAGLKMMNPVGKKLTPMLAICTQGFLFESGNFLFGSNLLGRMIGSILMCLWPIFQGLLMYVLLLGFSLGNVVNFFSEKTGIEISTAIAFLLSIKIVLAVSVCLLANFLSTHTIERYGSWIQSLENRLTPQAPPRKRWIKMLRSPVMISYILVNFYLYFTCETFESFVRTSLFYLCWMIAVFYIIDLFGAKIYARFTN